LVLDFARDTLRRRKQNTHSQRREDATHNQQKTATQQALMLYAFSFLPSALCLLLSAFCSL